MTNTWTFLVGSPINTTGTLVGSYGKKGVEGDGYMPGGRVAASMAYSDDMPDRLYVFGGVGFAAARVFGKLVNVI